MLIQNLSLKNFKCFEEVDVEFAPITLLTGANSSGKSSLIYSLLAVLQTEQFPFYLSPNGKYVNLGGFEEMAKRGKISFQVNLNLYDSWYNDFVKHKEVMKLRLATEWKNKDEIPSIELIKYHNEFNSIKKDTNHYTFSIRNSDKEICFEFKLESPEADLIDHYYFLLKLLLREKFIKKNNFSLHIPEIPFNGTVGDFRINFWNKFHTSILHQENPIREIEKQFNYIGSFRQPPERTYYQKAKAQSKVDTDGAGYIDQIIEWEETNPEKLAELAKIMSDLELFKEIKSNKFKGGRFELAVKTQENSELAALTDVGFGISQFLPIIVADLQLDDHSCLALSQPEIHLHPKIQALFGNFLANQIKRTQKQYIVETHSEYLLNRIRLLLVKGELKPEDVRVYYFENDGIKTTTHKVEFATDGQIKGAPESFFDTYAVDVMDIALNA